MLLREKKRKEIVIFYRGIIEWSFYDMIHIIWNMEYFNIIIMQISEEYASKL